MKTLRFLGKGVGHEHERQDCQDRLSVLVAANGRKIYAVADGCSSSAYAQQAAQCNIDTVNNLFSHVGIDELSRSSFVSLYPQLEKYWENVAEDDIAACLASVFLYEMARTAKAMVLSDARMADFCATLLFAVVEEDKTLVGHIGDGNVIFYDKQGEIVCISEEDNGADSTHTYFTVSPDFTRHFRTETIPTDSYESLVLFSDGPQTMFRMEYGTIARGAYEIAVAPAIAKQVKTEEEFARSLQKVLGHAMHYGDDDWSIIVSCNGDVPLTPIVPLSLNDLFMEEYEKYLASRKQAEEEAEPEADVSVLLPEADTQEADNGDTVPIPPVVYPHSDTPIAPQMPPVTETPADSETPADGETPVDSQPSIVNRVPSDGDDPKNGKKKRIGFTFAIK